MILLNHSNHKTNLLPSMTVDEKSVNELESIVKQFKIVNLNFKIDIVTLKDDIKLQYPIN